MINPIDARPLKERTSDDEDPAVSNEIPPIIRSLTEALYIEVSVNIRTQKQMKLL